MKNYKNVPQIHQDFWRNSHLTKSLLQLLLFNHQWFSERSKAAKISVNLSEIIIIFRDSHPKCMNNKSWLFKFPAGSSMQCEWGIGILSARHPPRQGLTFGGAKLQFIIVELRISFWTCLAVKSEKLFALLLSLQRSFLKLFCQTQKVDSTIVRKHLLLPTTFSLKMLAKG